MPQTLPHGSWPSPLSASDIAGSSPRFDGARLVGSEIWWGASVPEEGGRGTVRRRSAGGEVAEILPAPWSARSAVHEYGGGAWAPRGDGGLVFVEKGDQRVYSLTPGEEPQPLTPGGLGQRFGGLTVTGGALLAVRETQDARGTTHDAVRIPLDGSASDDPTALQVVASGTDFVAQPALSPDGREIAWIGWNHPHMPWERSELRRAPLGRPDEASVVAGGASAPVQPTWEPDGALLYSDDETGRWNLRRVRGGMVTEVAPADADTGGALWVLGSRWFAPLGGGRIAALRTNGRDELDVIEADGTSRGIPLPVSSHLLIEDAAGSRVLLTGAGSAVSSGLWLVDVETGAAEAVVGGAAPLPDAWLPTPRAVTYPGPHGPVHAFVYPPTAPGIVAPAGERAPYVVTVHGGPTSHVAGGLSGSIAYLTSRGIGVLDVNYGGSSGYGRAYRERLDGQWGIVDVDDVLAAVAGLVAEGDADAARIAIAGGSAGGWTVLAALAGSDVFAAGISRYGVADARALAADTHDFESRYLDGLIGPLPEAEAVYLERSPLSHTDRFAAPVLLLQGADDAVVPPTQSEAIRDALAARGIPHAYRLYEGEGHGFRRRETIIDAAETELAFLGAVFGFTPPGLPPLALD